MTRQKPAALRRRQSPGARARLATVRDVCLRAVTPLSALLALGIVVLLVERGVAALYAQPVAHIAVSGKLDSRYRDAVQETVASHIDRGLLGLDLPALQAQLQSLPWIYHAALRRRFPDTLEIHVVEQVPIARWGDGAFLNHEARVVEVADASQWDTLPEIRGPAGSQARLMQRYQRLLDLLRPLELQPLSLEEDPFGQLNVVFDSGIELALGDHDFAERMDDFLTLWRRELRDDRARVLRVDMRYETGAAVAFREQPQIAGLAAESGEG